VEQALLPQTAENGGFPEPPSGEPVRVVAARHEGCVEATRVRLPHTVPARAVRRLVCAQCSRDFEPPAVQELPSREGLLDRIDPSSPGWRIGSVLLAAAAVIGGLLLIRGGGDEEPAAPTPPTAAPTAGTAAAPDAGTAAARDSGRSSPRDSRSEAPESTPAGPASAAGDPGNTGEAKDEPERVGPAKPSKDITLVVGSEFRLALPAGWERVNPPSGATFKAVSPDGGADATLWIERDPGLAFDEFVSRSARQLEALAGTEPDEVVRVPAPRLEDSIVRLTADGPAGGPSYEVTLRAAGDYRYYLAVSIEPDASAKEVADADLLSGSLAPGGAG
jgi:hypothetical protein